MRIRRSRRKARFLTAAGPDGAATITPGRMRECARIEMRRLFIVLLAVLPAIGTSRAQELEPRAYSASPVGTNFVLAAFGDTRGEILFDPSIPLTDVHASLLHATVGYGRSFAFLGRQAVFLGAIPYIYGHVEGQVLEQSRRVERSGFGDARVKMSFQLAGPGALTPEEFARAPRRTIVGTSLTVQAPTGEYDGTKLINLGTNRWAFKPEVGISVPVGRWYLDGYAGVWFFTVNHDFFPGGNDRRQDPLATLQAHASYTFASRAWLALDATWYGGGEATVNDGPPSTRQNNTRLGATFSVPLPHRQALKLSAATGASARVGSDFDTYIVAWQITWLDRGTRRPEPSGAPADAAPH